MNNQPPTSSSHTNGHFDDQSFLGGLESQLEGFRRFDAERDALVQVGGSYGSFIDTH